MSGAGSTLGLVGLPLAAAALLALAPWPQRALRRVAAIAVGGQALLGVLVYIAFEAPPDMVTAAELLPIPQLATGGEWLPGLGARFALAVDGVNLYAVLSITAAAVIAVFVDAPLDGDAGSRPRLALIFAASAGLILFLLSRDLLLAAAGHGLAGLALAGVLALGGGSGAGDVARRFATWAAVGTILLSAAAVAAGATTGSTLIDDIVAGNGPVAVLPALLLGVALALQVPLVPFHTWLPPVCSHGGAAGRVLIAGGWCVAGCLGVVRFAVAVAPLELSAAAPLPLAWAAVTAAYGAILALAPRPEQSGQRAAWVCMALGGVAVAGIVSLDAGAVAGGAMCAAAQGPLRAVLLVLVVWSLRGGGGPRFAALWICVSLALTAAPGAGVFPGWLAVLNGLQRVAPWLASVVLGATMLGATALALSAVNHARASGARLPSRLTRMILAILLLSIVSGVRPAPFMAWARPEVDRLLSRSPVGDRDAPEIDDAATDESETEEAGAALEDDEVESRR